MCNLFSLGFASYLSITNNINSVTLNQTRLCPMRTNEKVVDASALMIKNICICTLCIDILLHFYVQEEGELMSTATATATATILTTLIVYVCALVPTVCLHFSH